MSPIKDLTRQRFGKLVVKEQHGFTEPNKYGQRYALWHCKCDCGNEVEVSAANIGKKTNSCGCLAKEHLAKMSQDNVTHGMTGTSLYRCYHGIMRRCYKTNCDHYHMYGGRGIAVCDEWKNDFGAFKKWALNNGYQEGLSLERIDVNKGYEPSNCTWIELSQQAHNKRQSRFYEMDGKTQDIAQWAKEYDIPYGTLWSRLSKGIELKDAIKKAEG